MRKWRRGLRKGSIPSLPQLSFSIQRKWTENCSYHPMHLLFHLITHCFLIFPAPIPPYFNFFLFSLTLKFLLITSIVMIRNIYIYFAISFINFSYLILYYIILGKKRECIINKYGHSWVGRNSLVLHFISCEVPLTLPFLYLVILSALFQYLTIDYMNNKSKYNKNNCAQIKK